MRKGVAVLMYHRIGVGPLAGREVGEDAYAVAPEVFREQLELLASRGCSVVMTAELAARSRVPAERGVVLTFDDGNRSDWSVALPALRQRGWTATSFVTPAFIGRPGYMTWPEVRELHQAGWCVGAHGLDHTPLATLPEAELRRHLREARRLLEAELAAPVETLSLPNGSGGRRVLAAAADAGYRIVFGSVPKLHRPGAPGPVPRLAVRRGDALGALGAWIEQRPVALRRALWRHHALSLLRSSIGPGLYQRARRAWAGSLP